jgi:Gpi18-like mannosyltransferase
MKKQFKKIISQKWFWLLIAILFGFILRLVLSPVFYHLDILSQAYWGEWIYNNGTKNFYYNNVWVYSWPTQPPLVNLVYAASFWLYINSLEWFRFTSHYIVPHLAPGHMLWYFDFVKWYTDAQYPESYLKLGFFLSIKFIAILADLFTAVVIFLILRKESSQKAFLLATLYLFSPFSFYISALWGQFDQLSFLFLLLSVWALIKKNVFIAPFLLMISVSMKPTSLIFIPLFGWIYLSARKNILEYIAGIALAIGGFLLTITIFTNDNLWQFINYDLKNKILFKSGFRVSTNSFNFWHVFIGNNAREHFTPYLGIPAYVWGWLSFAVINLIAIWIVRVKNQKTILTAFAVVGLGSWIFMINMLERYVFAGVVFSMMCLVYYPKFLKAWLVMSIIFWVNLYHGWWVPRQWEWLHQAIIWNDNTVTRILSAINVVIFFIFVKTLKLPVPKFLKIKK